ncbi:Branched-chain amino acid ABC transporter, amino acid-binding protein [Rhodovulum sp. PH10]|uniref:ABC transporter substrate-binding protein n=1 Tax=Rhodovulum sp. PH10 TaxID=1187851 RepID=UPI00027C2DA8|nr:ABC transporter substrate-binding protein [Rhodovulum sp. PH10]EJW11053.1 Branched-chain amino acid ABC transporter, amino acid-binding protein [Rhodovulum sp. PH10]
MHIDPRKAALSVLAAGLMAAPAFAQDTIKIGVTQPLTGAFAASGNYVAQGAKIAEDEINAKGGVLGKKIQLVIEDNKSNPTEAVATVEKLIVRDKVPAIMGAWSSTLTLAVMPKVMEYKVPLVVETSSSGKITTAGNPYVFRIAPTSDMEAVAFTPLIDKLNIKKAAFLNTNNDFGIGSAKAYSEALKKKGVEIGVMETMDPKATDFSAQLTSIKASGADTLFVTTAVEQITLVLKQAKELQLDARIITTGGSNSPDQLIAQAGSAADGSYHVVFFPPWFPDVVKNPEAAKSYMTEWKKRGHEPGGMTEGFRGYDGIYTIAEAIKVAGKAEPAAIKDALWKVTVHGVYGDIKFTQQGPKGKESGQNVPSVYLVKIEDGKVVNPEL